MNLPRSLNPLAHPPRLPMWARVAHFFKHLWMDASDSRRVVPPDLAREWRQRMADSETRHAGEIRLCVEAALPLSYLWRVVRTGEVQPVVQQRARMMFSKLGVWDTERNTGVLIYVLLAEHAIELVADRGLRGIPAQAWQAITDDLAQAFREGQAQAGLKQALGRCEALLLSTGLASDEHNELADEPFLQ
jgi:hypothetical protein